MTDRRANAGVGGSAVGKLGPGGRGSFTLPSGLATRDHGVVDISAQRYDGDPRHQRSRRLGR